MREIVGPHNPLKVLDVACGTGDFTIEIAEKLAAGFEQIEHTSMTFGICRMYIGYK